MTPLRPLRLLVAAVALGATAATAQSASTDYRDEFLRQFEGSSRKITMLAEAMPQELYDWSPSEGVMSVARVYMHIARYNFMYPEDALGIPAPSSVDLDTMEEIRDKTQVTRILQESVAHVRESVQRMTSADLEASTRLYGREIAKWAVLLQLIAHMNEHVGQSVAYARMNDIVPPWSR
jgi:uncharacterized damage-inducible protein DinB